MKKDMLQTLIKRKLEWPSIRVDIRAKKITRDKEGHNIMIKGSIH